MKAPKGLLTASIFAVHLSGMMFAPATARSQSVSPTKQSVTTYRFDNYQSGVNSNESVLTPANVKSGTFGSLFASPIDGQAYAQPLYLSNLTVAGAKHNVAYVVTMHDSIYAFDADTGASLWKVSFISADASAVPLVVPVPSTDLPGSGGSDVGGNEVGIESTPVIDESTGTIYLVAKTKETGRGDGHQHYVQKLHALDVATGGENFGGPQVIADTTCDNPTARGSNATFDFNLTANPQTPSAVSNNTAADSYTNGKVYLNGLRNLQRCSLTLANGVVYVGWASHGDERPYHGWLVGFSAQTLRPITTPNLVFCDTPDGWQGGVWQGGAGPTVDNDGNLFISTANAGAQWCANQTTGDIAESFIKFKPANGLSVVSAGFDFWAPADAPGLGNADSGVGSGGLTLIDVPGTTIKRLCMGGSKNGKLYVVNRDNMGHFDTTKGDNDIQTFTVNNFYFGEPVFFNNCLFFDAATIQGYTFNAADSTFTASGSTSYNFSSRGDGLVISANGTSSGIIWSFSQGVIKAVRPESIAGSSAQNNVSEFYQTPLGDRSTVKFTHPIVINGHVYAANMTAFLGYGLLNATKPSVTVAATQGTATAGGQAGSFTLTRAGSTLGNLLVAYTTSGTAQSGTDYTALPGTVTIPDGAVSITLPVNATAGAQNNVVVTLQVSTNSNYDVGTASQASVTISNPNAGSFAAWQQSNFGVEAGSSNAAPGADYDHDGLANLLEYALATNPKAPQTTPAYTLSVASNHLKIAFNRVLQPDANLIIRVSASNTLASGSWTTLATKSGGGAWVAVSGVSVTDDAGTGAVTVTDVQTLDAQPKRFLRMTADLVGN